MERAIEMNASRSRQGISHPAYRSRPQNFSYPSSRHDFMLHPAFRQAYVRPSFQVKNNQNLLPNSDREAGKTDRPFFRPRWGPLNKVLYREVPPRGPKPYPKCSLAYPQSYTIFDRKGITFVYTYTFHRKLYPFIYL